MTSLSVAYRHSGHFRPLLCFQHNLTRTFLYLAVPNIALIRAKYRARLQHADAQLVLYIQAVIGQCHDVRMGIGGLRRDDCGNGPGYFERS